VPAAAVRTFAEHVSDSQTVHNGTYRPVADESVDGDWLLVRFPAFFDGHIVETANLASPTLDSADEDQTRRS